MGSSGFACPTSGGADPRCGWVWPASGGADQTLALYRGDPRRLAKTLISAVIQTMIGVVIPSLGTGNRHRRVKNNTRLQCQTLCQWA